MLPRLLSAARSREAVRLMRQGWAALDRLPYRRIVCPDTEFRTKQENPRTRLNVGVGGPNELFTHLQSVGSRTPLPLKSGETYLLVAKIVAGRTDADQVFMRVYGPDEPIDRQEPGSWSVVGPPFRSDLVFDWLEVHINSRTRQALDEIRLGTTWSSVTAPWAGPARDAKREKP